MSATPIFALDAQATPVNHQFVPIGLDAQGVFYFEDVTPNGGMSPMGSWRISLGLKRPPAAVAGTSSANRTFRATVGLHEPILETLGTNTVSGIPPSPTIAYISRAITEYILPERATPQNRKDLRKMSAIIQGDAQVVTLVENLFMPYG
jgi:hypothetical protein